MYKKTKAFNLKKVYRYPDMINTDTDVTGFPFQLDLYNQ